MRNFGKVLASGVLAMLAVCAESGHEPETRILGAALSHDARLAATLGYDRKLIVWDVATGAIRQRFETSLRAGAGLVFSPDGRFVLAAGASAAYLGEVATGKLRTLTLDAFSVQAVRFSPDGREALAAAVVRTDQGAASWIQVWDIATGNPARRLHIPAIDFVFLPNGRIRTAQSEGLLREWDPVSGAEIAAQARKAALPLGELYHLRFSADGRYLAGSPFEKNLSRKLADLDNTGDSKSDTGPIVLFDGATGRALRTARLDFPLETLAVSPDARYAAVAEGRGNGGSGRLRLWDLRTGAWRELDGSGLALAVAFSGDGRHLITGHTGALARVWPAEGAAGPRRLGPATAPRDVPQPAAIALPQKQHSVRLEVQTSHSWPGGISGAALSHDGRRAATFAPDKRLVVWDVPGGRVLRHFETGIDGEAQLVFSPDGRRVLIGSGALRAPASLADVETGQVRQLGTGAMFVRAVAFSRDGRWALTAVGEYIQLWDAATGAPGRRIDSPVLDMVTLPDGRLQTVSLDAVIRRIDLSTGEALPGLGVRVGLEHGFGHSLVARFSPGGRYLIGFDMSGATPGPLTVFDAATGKAVRTLRDGPRRMLAAVSPDGRYAAAVETGADVIGVGRTWLWDVRTGLCRELDRAASVAFSPDGRFLIAGQMMGRAQVLGLDGKTPGQVLAGAARPVWVVRLCKGEDGKGQYALTAFQTGDVAVWNLADGRPLPRIPADPIPEAELRLLDADARQVAARELASLDSPNPSREAIAVARAALDTSYSTPGVEAAEFSPRGNYALLGGFQPKLLNLRTWEVTRLGSRKGAITAVAFSRDERLAATGEGGRACVWSVATHRELRCIPHQGFVNHLAFSSDGSLLATVDSGNWLRVFSIPTGIMGSVRELRSAGGKALPVGKIAFESADRLVRVFAADGTSQVVGLSMRGGAPLPPEEPPAPVASDYSLAGSGDGGTQLKDATGRVLATLYSFPNGAWAVVDPGGRYDASQPEDMREIYWLIDNRVVHFGQLKGKYYVPFLLNRILERLPLPAVARLQNLAPPPEIRLQPPAAGNGTLQVHVRNQGGGIGRLVVKVNGRDVGGTLRAPRPAPEAPEAVIPIDLRTVAHSPEGRNRVEIRVYGRDDMVASRSVEMVYDSPPSKVQPRLFGLVCGVSRYADPGLQPLQYADKDASDFFDVLQRGARRMLGEGNVHLRLMTTTRPAEAPTKDKIRAVLDEIRSKARPEDIVVLFLAGHGKAAAADFFYFTPEANTDDRTQALSGRELLTWVTGLAAQKQVLILDACEAGAMADTVLDATRAKARAVSQADRLDALEKLNEATGAFVLMGSADGASLEAPRFQHGLLTYALLDAMRRTAPSRQSQLDISAIFAEVQDQVPLLARRLQRWQRPLVSMPRGISFPLGVLDEHDLGAIRLAGKPELLGVYCFTEKRTDPLHLANPLRAALRKLSSSGDLVYQENLDSDTLPRPWVTYRLSDRKVDVTVELMRNENVIRRREMTLDVPDEAPAAALAPAIAASIAEELQKAASR